MNKIIANVPYFLLLLFMAVLFFQTKDLHPRLRKILSHPATKYIFFALIIISIVIYFIVLGYQPELLVAILFLLMIYMSDINKQ